jgi:hypothetical protein
MTTYNNRPNEFNFSPEVQGTLIYGVTGTPKSLSALIYGVTGTGRGYVQGGLSNPLAVDSEKDRTAFESKESKGGE